MSRQILILEPSVTLQEVFKEKTKKSDLELSFDTNGIRFLVTLYNMLPDAVLINARNMNPSCMELCRLIKSVARFKNIPVGIYVTSDFVFPAEFKSTCGADMFIIFKPEDIVLNLEELCSKKDSELVVPEKYDSIKNGSFQKIFFMFEHLEAFSEVVENVLNLVAEVCQIPAVSIMVNVDEGVEGFYICPDNFKQEETDNFLEVCVNDFENHFPNQNMTDFVPRRLRNQIELEKYHNDVIPLSAYQVFEFKNSKMKPFGTLHVVREGAFSSKQMDIFSYLVKEAALLLETCLKIKQRMKFERNIRKAFSRFVPEQIIDELVDEAEKNEKVGVGEKRDVAILFSDIRSFTNISEHNKPEVIVGFLNRYFTIMTTIIKKHGGTVDKFIGDAIMALFGAPVSYEDNTRRAVAAACEMRDALASVPLDGLVLPDGMKFDIGIGIHYGDVIVGSIGSDDKTDYSVIGDNVNLASRLEGLTKKYGSMIVVSESVKNDIKTDDFTFRHLDDVKVKGKAKAVPIYAVDNSIDEFPLEYRDSYDKGLALYQKGVWNLAREYFSKALEAYPEDKATKLMLERCEDFIANPPDSWDGAIAFNTK